MKNGKKNNRFEPENEEKLRKNMQVPKIDAKCLEKKNENRERNWQKKCVK